MKFGALPEDRLAGIDLSLPKEPPGNTMVLPGVRAAHPKFYMGAARWGHSSWTGRIYPSKTPASQFRQLYPRYFSAVELNATHYKIYDPAVLRQWREAAAGRDFRFCPKFPQAISHYSGFKNAEALTTSFLESVLAFENNLGPIFFTTERKLFSGTKRGAVFLSFFLTKRPELFLRGPSSRLVCRQRERSIVP